MKLLALAAITVTALTAGRVSADLVVTVESKDLDASPPRIEVSKIYMTTDKLKVEGAGKQAGGAPAGDAERAARDYSMIYRGDRQVVWVVDPAAKSYMTIDKQSMQRLSEQVNAVTKKMQEQMAQMPPEQRKMLEQYMKGKPAAEPQAKTAFEIKDTGVRQTLQGYPCLRYDVLVDGKKESEVWVTTWEKAGISKDSFEIFKQMAAFYRDMMSSMPMLQGASPKDRMWSGLDRIDGFPVLVRSFDGEKARTESTFKPAGGQKLDAALFEIPAEFSEQKLLPGQGPHGEK